MKRILISLSIIVAVAAIAIGGTRAYFSDTATSTNNSFQAGTLDLKLSNDNSSYSDSITGTFNTSDMVPGATETTGTVRLKNEGNVPAGHVNITSVVNTPSDNGINEPECKAYNGEWKWYTGGTHRYLCVLSNSINYDTCNTYGGKWYNFESKWSGYGNRCYAEVNTGFKDGIGGWNDIDKHLQITSIKYAGKELSFEGHSVVNSQDASYTEVDANRNGYLDLDDLEKDAVAKRSWLRNLTPGVGPNEYHTFQMTVKLNQNAGNVYQTDKDGIKITFELTQQ